jgi:xanthine/CO dehydrogenase XdhC/CoxF family maturation factor
MFDAPLEQAEAWMLQGKEVAIATVLRTSEISSIPVGHQLAIDEEGNDSGSLLPRTVENSLVAQAAKVIASGVPIIFQVNMEDGAVQATTMNESNHLKIFLERVG